MEGGEERDSRAEASGETLGEAKWAAVRKLQSRFPGLTDAEVAFEVAEEGGPDGARVLATADVEAWEERGFGLPDEPAERMRALLERVLLALDLRASVEIVEEDDRILGRVSGGELGLFIGKHGQTIDAVQLLCLQTAFRDREREERKRVVVDAAGYRERREAILQRKADRAVEEALRFKRPAEMESMGSQERRVIHTYLKDRGGVETYSEGDEPHRFVVVAPLVSE